MNLKSYAKNTEGKTTTSLSNNNLFWRIKMKTCRDCAQAEAKGLQTVYCKIRKKTLNLFFEDYAEECPYYKPK